MSEAGPIFIQSRDNALVKDLRRLAQDNGAYRKQGRVWVAGDHLCRAALARGWRPAMAGFCESYLALAQAAIAPERGRASLAPCLDWTPPSSPS